ncbi:MAG: glycosyltransferase [Candidatus Omnitrophica bacterium]|nr:glycosyltransferase [Candidatus Omnitrophota bacterium]
MKILFIANRAEVFSGGQISLLELVANLDRNKIEPVVLCPGKGQIYERTQAMGITSLVWDMPTAKTLDLFRMFDRVSKLRSIIKAQNADIVHTNGSRAQFYAALARRGTQAKLVWHLRESTPDIFLYDWFIAKSADMIVCVSNGTAQKRITSRFPMFADKTEVVYNGVDTETFKRNATSREKVRDELGVKNEDILIGLIGLIIPQKGHQILLKALSVLIEDHPNIKLLVMGRSIDAAYLERVKTMANQLGLGPNVFISGQRDDMVSVLSALDIFALPSQGEGFSRVLIEAMSVGLPVIATDVSGNNEAITKETTGFLVPYGDVYLLAEDIQKLINNRRMAINMGLSARKRVEENFSMREHVSGMQKIYGKLKEGTS